MLLLDKHFHVHRTNYQDGYKVTAGSLEEGLKGIHDEQKILVLNDPHNPAGNLYTEMDLGEIAEVCRRNETLILADEIYAMTTYDFDGFTSLGKIYPEGTFVSNGLSKGWSAGGYRFGYLVLPEGFSKELREAFVKVAGTVYTNVSTPPNMPLWRRPERVMTWRNISR